MRIATLLLWIILISSCFLALSGCCDNKCNAEQIQYGPDKKEVLYFFPASDPGPLPAKVQVNIHGGGLLTGKPRSNIPQSEHVTNHVIELGYPLMKPGQKNILPTQNNSVSYALQFIRSRADEWYIDPKQINVYGRSAGGLLALWLATSEDRIDLFDPDPVRTFSSRPNMVTAENAQSTLDIDLVRERIGVAAFRHYMMWKPVGAKSWRDVINNWDKYKPLSDKYTALKNVSPGDVPLRLIYKLCPNTVSSANQAIHHHEFGRMLKEKYDLFGLNCELIIYE